ncbi:MAG: hypothetical protein ABI583_04465 [Betaproteobacteria bacterium]
MPRSIRMICIELLVPHLLRRGTLGTLLPALAACAVLSQMTTTSAQTPLKPPVPIQSQSPLSSPNTAIPVPLAPPTTSLKAAQPAVKSTGTTSLTSVTAVSSNSVTAIKFAPGLMTLSQLRALPANTMIELRSGQKVKASQFTATADALKDLGTKKASLKRMDFVFTRPTAVAKLKLNAGNLAAARAMAPNTVLELPNGIKLTSAELKKLDALEARTNIRQLLGGNAPSAAGANRYAGQPAIQLRTKADVEKLKGKPDNTVIEAPDGTRSTLGELKAALAEKYKR